MATRAKCTTACIAATAVVTRASALAGRLALGEELTSAVRSALDYTWRTLRDAEAPGHGQYVPRRLPLDLA
jgi:hydroxymethylpyrimidine/phosphomethylpyrimidine kinase